MDEKNKKKVLIVDDEPAVRRLLQRMLSNDYTVLEAQDGAEAVNMARSQKPDIILMDIMMPKMDGYTACNIIKTDEATKAITIVMVTAVGYELNVKLSREMGAEGYITKPFNQQDLLDTVGRLLKGPK